jgi:hypothetical protein
MTTRVRDTVHAVHARVKQQSPGKLWRDDGEEEGDIVIYGRLRQCHGFGF